MTRRNPPSGPQSADQANAAARRAQALRQAAKDKQNNAVRRAEAGLRQLVKDGQEISFRAVARTGGISIDFLYTHPELRTRIEKLREQCHAAQPPTATTREPAASDGTVVHTLTAALRQERTAHRERVNDLEQRLAAAHGEILRLRRALNEHGLNG
jgi:hypothetical protein